MSFALKRCKRLTSGGDLVSTGYSSKHGGTSRGGWPRYQAANALNGMFNTRNAQPSFAMAA